MTDLRAWRAVLATTLLTSSAALAQSRNPVDPVSILDQGLTSLLALPSTTPFERRYTQLLPVIDQAFDLSATLQAIVGPTWATLPANDQQTLLESFRRYTVSSYAVNFFAGGGTTIKLQPGSQSIGSGQLVSTLIVPANGEPTKINYVVKHSYQGWRITDVYLDGSISQVAVQRSDFRSLLTSNNASALTQRLNSKVAELSGGAVKP